MSKIPITSEWALEDRQGNIHIIKYDGGWWGLENIGIDKYNHESKHAIRETIKWFFEKYPECGYYYGYTWIQLQ